MLRHRLYLTLRALCAIFGGGVVGTAAAVHTHDAIVIAKDFECLRFRPADQCNIKQQSGWRDEPAYLYSTRPFVDGTWSGRKDSIGDRAGWFALSLFALLPLAAVVGLRRWLAWLTAAAPHPSPEHSEPSR